MHWYALAFSDIQSRLPFGDFIYREAICNRPMDDGRSRSWKVVAYAGGTKAIDELLQAASTRDAAKRTTNPAEQIAKLVRTRLAEKLFEMIKCVDPSDSASTGEMLRLFGLPGAGGEKPEGGPAAQADYLKNIEVMVRDFPWSVGVSRMASELREWSEKAVELRPADLLRVTQGQKLPNEGELKRVVPRASGEEQ